MLRAMIVLGVPATIKGGVWSHARDLAVTLRERGHEVKIGLTSRADELGREAASLDVPIVALEAAARDRHSLFHLHLHNTYDAYAMRLLVARRRAGPTVLTEHLPRTNAADERLLPGDHRTPGGHTARTIFKRCQYSLAHRIIAVSTSSGDFLAERYGDLAEKVVVVHNGVAVAPAVERMHAQRPGPTRVALLGSLIPQKGHDVLIAAARHAAQDWRAEVYGSGACLKQLVAAAGDVAGHVAFMGWSNSSAEVLRAADVLCVPSRWEASSYGALEAMAACVPVVASRVDGLDEIVHDNVTGRLVPPEDPVALAAALDGLAVDPELRAAMGIAGHARTVRLWGLDKMVSGTERVYLDARQAARFAG